MRDEKQTFSTELLLKSLLTSTNENNDLLTLLLDVVDESDKNINVIKNGVEDLKISTDSINKKLDSVLEKLNDIEESFGDLKNETRDLEQKIILMGAKLDKIENDIDEEELEDYYCLCQSLYDNWDELDELTKKLIPVAEYMYSKLQKYDKTDFSPVILELCRALENEFLLKIFRKYTLDVLRRQGKDLDFFLSVDRGSYFLKNKTGIFVKAVARSAKTHNPEYTLGQMNTVMSLMNDKKVVSESPLLQDFKKYLEHETIAKDLLNVQYIKKINEVVEKYRNPSAHPGFMDIDKASQCKEIMPERMDYLMECIMME